ncbi:MAG: hypothetical protein WC890_00995 [Candidatus Margulisiibacteriota bacterium]
MVYSFLVFLFIILGPILFFVGAMKPKMLWYMLIPACILGSGIMLGGYALIDEYLVDCIFFGILFAFSIGAIPFIREKISNFDKLHLIIFLLMSFYMVFQCIRGVIISEDIRMMRFVIYYLLLGIMPFILSNRYFMVLSSNKAAMITAISGLLYMLTYFFHGFYSEFVLKINRFLPQGSEWSGSAAAVFPVLMSITAVLCYNENAKNWFSRLLVFLVAFISLIVGFYYDSRMVILAVVGLMFIYLPRIRLREILIILLMAIILVSWNNTLTVYSKYSFTDYFLVGIQATEAVSGQQDKDRGSHFKRAFVLLDNNIVSALVGEGWYSHKLILGQRSTAFAALMIDTGLIGMLLTTVCFLFAFIKVLISRSKYSILLMLTIFMSFAWLMVAPILDIVLLYIMIMPFGLINQLSNNMVVDEVDK